MFVEVYNYKFATLDSNIDDLEILGSVGHGIEDLEVLSNLEGASEVEKVSRVLEGLKGSQNFHKRF